MYPNVHSSPIYNTQDGKNSSNHQQTTDLRRCGTSMCVHVQTQTQSEILLSHKKE